MEKFNLEDFAIRKYDPELYKCLLKEYYNTSSKYIKNLFWSNQDIEFYQGFRKWMIDEHKCWNSAGNTLCFKTEADYIWFMLNYV